MDDDSGCLSLFIVILLIVWVAFLIFGSLRWSDADGITTPVTVPASVPVVVSTTATGNQGRS